MPYQVDLEQMETKFLRDAADWERGEVLEIGCGIGRLARRIESLGANVMAIDPHLNRVKTAMEWSDQSIRAPIRYGTSNGQRLPFVQEAFEIVLFGWSL